MTPRLTLKEELHSATRRRKGHDVRRGRAGHGPPQRAEEVRVLARDT